MGRRAEELRARVQRVVERADELRRRHAAVDAVYVLVDRDSEVGGGIMGGALAYRLFIWLLPFALVLVGGIGLASSAVGQSSGDSAESVGIHGLLADSIAESSRGSSRFYAIAIGIPILLWATRGLLRALVVVHRLVWGDPRRTVPKASALATVRLLGFLVAFFVIRAAASWVGRSTGSAILGTVVGLGGVVCWWLAVSVQLPHRGVQWTALVPGAVLVGVGLELMSIVSVYVIAPRVESSQSAYGTLGAAATILFGLYLVSRLVVASAVLNATVWSRRNPDGDGIGSPAP